MKRLMLIIYKETYNDEVLVDRIKNLGDGCSFLDNHWLVETELSAKEVYDKIAANGYEKRNIFVIEAGHEQGKSYWGFMDVSLWDWLKKVSKEIKD